MNRKFIVRHEILKALQLQFSANDNPNAMVSDWQLSITKIAEISKLKESEIYNNIDYLHDKKEIDIIEEPMFNFSYIILRNGTIAFHDRKYIEMAVNSSGIDCTTY